MADRLDFTRPFHTQASLNKALAEDKSQKTLPTMRNLLSLITLMYASYFGVEAVKTNRRSQALALVDLSTCLWEDGNLANGLEGS